MLSEEKTLMISIIFPELNVFKNVTKELNTLLERLFLL